MGKKITIGLIISWLFGAMFTFAGITTIFSEPLPGFIMLIMAAVILPPVIKFVAQKWKFHISKKIKAIVIIIGFIIFGATVDAPDVSTIQDSQLPKEEQLQGKVQNQITDEVKIALPNYQIETKDFLEPYKASFDIRLENKISEEEIENIAKNLKDANPGYETYFILYYLPDMEIGTGAWATSHFNPSLSVKILGLTSEEEEKVKNESLVEEEEEVGKWIDESSYASNITIIFIQNNQYKLRQIFKDGSSLDKDLEKQGNIYNYPNDLGEYIEIENNGDLSWYDEYGKIKTIKKSE